MSLLINDDYFGELLPFVKDEKITDICWNGEALWLDHLEKGRYKVETKLSPDFVKTFAQRLSNLANKNFNMSEPLLEAETDELRISIVHESVTNTGISISIRKTPAVRRLNDEKMLKDGYTEKDMLNLLSLFVKGHCSTIVTGDVGSGKTELVKYLTKFIPSEERTISIEDNFELRLKAINPNLDAVEIKAVGERFNYSLAIKAALRQLCKWLLLSEARSTEVIQLLEAASTGCVVMTTIHSDDVRKLPDRIVNMMGLSGEEKRNDVYNFFDIGIKVSVKKTKDGIKRRISQLAVFDREDDENSLTVIYENGFTGAKLPYNIWKKIEESATEEQLELFMFLKPNSITQNGGKRFDAKTLNQRFIDKGKSQQPEIIIKAEDLARQTENVKTQNEIKESTENPMPVEDRDNPSQEDKDKESQEVEQQEVETGEIKENKKSMEKKLEDLENAVENATKYLNKKEKIIKQIEALKKAISILEYASKHPNCEIDEKTYTEIKSLINKK